MTAAKLLESSGEDIPPLRTGSASFHRVLNLLVEHRDPCDGYRAAVRHHPIVLHENTHWFQCHSTSIGVFMLKAKAERDRLAIEEIRGLPLDIRVKWMRARARGIGAASSLGDVRVASIISRFRLESMLIRAFDGPNAHDDYVVADGTTYASLLQRVGATRYNGRTLSGAPPDWGQVEGARITTRLLFEGWAVAAEWLGTLPAFPYDPELRQELTARLVEDDYAAPFRFFWRLSPDGDLPSKVFTFCVVCWTACNPPLPPLDNRGWEGANGEYWPDIDPPTRFGHLVKAVAQIGLIEPHAGHEAVGSYISELCDAAIVWIRVLECDSLARFTTAWLDGLANSQVTQWQFARRVIMAMLEGLHRRLSLAVCPTLLHTVYATDYLELIGNPMNHLWMFPPWRIDHLGHLGFTSERPDVSFAQSASNCLARLIPEVISGEGTVPFDSLPDSFSTGKPLRWFKGSICSTFDVDPSILIE